MSSFPHWETKNPTGQQGGASPTIPVLMQQRTDRENWKCGASLWDWMGMWALGGCHLGWHLGHRVGMVARQEVKGAGVIRGKMA